MTPAERQQLRRDRIKSGLKRVEVWVHTHAEEAVRLAALTPAEATAALAARDAAMRAQGLREAAEWYRVAGWKLDEDDVPDAILARAAEIERDAK